MSSTEESIESLLQKEKTLLRESERSGQPLTEQQREDIRGTLTEIIKRASTGPVEITRDEVTPEGARIVEMKRCYSYTDEKGNKQEGCGVQKAVIPVASNQCYFTVSANEQVPGSEQTRKVTTILACSDESMNVKAIGAVTGLTPQQVRNVILYERRKCRQKKLPENCVIEQVERTPPKPPIERPEQKAVPEEEEVLAEVTKKIPVVQTIERMFPRVDAVWMTQYKLSSEAKADIQTSLGCARPCARMIWWRPPS